MDHYSIKKKVETGFEDRRAAAKKTDVPFRQDGQ